MSPSGASTATAVTRIVRPRGSDVMNERRAGASAAGAVDTEVVLTSRLAAAWLLGRQRLLPAVQEVEPLLRIEIAHDLRAHRNGLHVAAELLIQLRGRVFGLDVVADAEQLHVAADELL